MGGRIVTPPRRRRRDPPADRSGRQVPDHVDRQAELLLARHERRRRGGGRRADGSLGHVVVGVGHRAVGRHLGDQPDPAQLRSRRLGHLLRLHLRLVDDLGPGLGLQRTVVVDGEAHRLHPHGVAHRPRRRVDDAAGPGDVAERDGHRVVDLVAGDPPPLVVVRRVDRQLGRLDVLGLHPLRLQRVDQGVGLVVVLGQRLPGTGRLRLHAEHHPQRVGRPLHLPDPPGGDRRPPVVGRHGGRRSGAGRLRAVPGAARQGQRRHSRRTGDHRHTGTKHWSLPGWGSMLPWTTPPPPRFPARPAFGAPNKSRGRKWETTPYRPARRTVRVAGMTTTPDLTASPDDQSKPTLTGAVPLVPLGRPQLAAAARVAAGAARHPLRLAAAGLTLTGELASAATGAAKREPERGDRRFADPAWAENPVYRRVLQGYLGAAAVAGDTVGRLGLDPKSEERGRFVVGQVVDALAPTNTLLGNPAALKRAAATRGASLAKGARQLADDVLHNGGMPQTVDRRPFRLGETIATSPGAVVLRTDVFELIQYQPATPTVGTVPVVFIPPEISRHYILDLSPGRSLVEFLVGQGHPVFMISWRNPAADQRDWNLDTYVASCLQAVTTAALIAGSPDVHLVGACAGGITAAALAGHLAATGERRLRTLTFFVTVLDTAAETMASLFLSEWSAALAVRG